MWGYEGHAPPEGLTFKEEQERKAAKRKKDLAQRRGLSRRESLTDAEIADEAQRLEREIALFIEENNLSPRTGGASHE